MCLLAVCEKSKMKRDEFMEAFRSNNDGAGFAWPTNDGMIAWKKGFMNMVDAWNFYKDLDVFPHICHFRKGDPVINTLTHPFICIDESPLSLEGTTDKPLLFHNGIISSWKDKFFSYVTAKGKIPEGEWSDTRVLACLVGTVGKEIMKFVDGKFALMEVNAITRYGDFTEDSGIYYSNSSYKVMGRSTYYHDWDELYDPYRYTALCEMWG